MEIIHYKAYPTKIHPNVNFKQFLCCDNTPELVDILESSEHQEFVQKKCSKCNKIYKEETIFGKQTEGYPHVTTFISS